MRITIHKPGEPDQMYEAAGDVRLKFEPVHVGGATTSDLFARTEVPIEGCTVTVEAAPTYPPPGEFRTRQLESYPLGRHVEPGHPPAPRVMLTIPDSRQPEPEPTEKSKRKPKVHPPPRKGAA